MPTAKSISYQLNGTFTGYHRVTSNISESMQTTKATLLSGKIRVCHSQTYLKALEKTCSGDVRSAWSGGFNIWALYGWYVAVKTWMSVPNCWNLYEFITPPLVQPQWKKRRMNLANHQSDGKNLGVIGKKLKPITLNNHLRIMRIMRIIPSSTVCQIKLRDLYSSELTLWCSWAKKLLKFQGLVGQASIILPFRWIVMGAQLLFVLLGVRFWDFKAWICSGNPQMCTLIYQCPERAMLCHAAHHNPQLLEWCKLHPWHHRSHGFQGWIL